MVCLAEKGKDFKRKVKLLQILAAGLTEALCARGPTLYYPVQVSKKEEAKGHKALRLFFNHISFCFFR